MKPKSNLEKPVPSQEGTAVPDKESSDVKNEEWAEKLPHENDPNWED